jgi:PHD/YefM family antitoxin component YafN of YafNO toxin-antitoxin module
MAITHVLGTSEAREQLSQVLERFRRDGADAEPMLFGPHRKAEAVVLPVAVWERLLLMEEQGKFAAAPYLQEAVRRAGTDPDAPTRRVKRRPRPTAASSQTTA